MPDLIPAWVGETLTPVEKLDAHLRGLRHKAVSVFLLRGDALLLQRRALGKYHTPGLWANTCCTHPHWDETQNACATRRLDEELGLANIALTPRGQVEYRADVGNGMIEHEVVDLFIGSLPEGVTPMPNPDEVMDTDWVSLSDLQERVSASPELYTPWLRIYLNQHAEAIFGGLPPAP